MTDIDTQRDELVDRLFSAGVTMGEVLTVYPGDVLGLYRALSDHGATTPAELAHTTGVYERYAREWLDSRLRRAP